MKNLITSTACIMILIALVMQFTQNQITYIRVMAVDQAVNSFKETVKQEGCITDNNEDYVKKEIGRILSCDEGEVKVTGDRNAALRGKLVHYGIAVDIRGVIGTPGFWGISDEENRFEYKADYYTTSEYTGR